MSAISAVVDTMKAMSEEILSLREQVAALESREVCTVAHENVETCGYCQRDALAAENAALRKDAEARSLYDRTAAAQGFTNAPHWNELAEETRQMYRDERAKRDAAMGESHE